METRKKRWRFRFILSRSFLYSLIVLIITIGYALLVAGLSLIINNFVSINNTLVTGVLIFLIALLFIPLRQRLDKVVNSIFFRTEQVLQERLQVFINEMTNLLEISKITKVLWQHIEQVLWPNGQHIFLYDSRINQYVAIPNPKNELTTDIRFLSNSKLIEKMVNEQSSIIVDLDQISSDLQSEQSLELVTSLTSTRAGDRSTSLNAPLKHLRTNSYYQYLEKDSRFAKVNWPKSVHPIPPG